MDGKNNLTTDLNFDGAHNNINKDNGLRFPKATTDASNVMTVANHHGHSDSEAFLLIRLRLLLIRGVYVLTASTGLCYFGSTSRFESASGIFADVLISSNSGIYRCLDAHDSVNTKLSAMPTEKNEFSIACKQID